MWQESRSQGLDGLSKTWHVSGAQDTLLQWASGCHNLIQSPLNWNPSRTGITPYLALHHQHTTCATVHSPDSSWSLPNISSTVNVHIIQVGGEENSFGVAAVDCLLIGISAPSPAAPPLPTMAPCYYQPPRALGQWGMHTPAMNFTVIHSGAMSAFQMYLQTWCCSRNTVCLVGN